MEVVDEETVCLACGGWAIIVTSDTSLYLL
jgi:hypothetical protein